MDRKYAKKSEAAAFLEIPERTLYLGRLGTKHLRRTKRGPHNLRWYWAQLERHEKIARDKGECTGECEAVFAEIEKSERFLHAVG